ncbi:hypothetical protein Taro_017052, partial [Colocasia esculenta]|nr:hypothetical protein [Colocasia esculenta]
GSSPTSEHARTSHNLPIHTEPSASSHGNCTTRRHAFYDRPTTLQYLLEALETRGQQTGARENENQVGVNPSAAKNNRQSKRPHPMPLRSCSQRPLTWTPIGQRPPLAANSN